MEKGRSAFKMLTGKPTGKRWPRRRWEDNIRMDLEEIGIKHGLLHQGSNEEYLKKKILRRKFGPKRDANVKWARLHSEELHSLYRSPNIG